MTPDVVVAFITVCGSVICTIFAGVFAVHQAKIINDKEDIIRGYRLPSPIPNKDKRNTILLVALGGTGKTALIRSLFQNQDANPQEATMEFDIYHGIRESNRDATAESLHVKYWFRIADYKGQNIGDLVRAFIQQQKNPYPVLAYGFVDSLIIMVDLLPPKPTKESPELTPVANFDTNRVSHHVEQWNENALNAIFGLLTADLKYVCLFINKIDLMANRTLSADEGYIDAFKVLIDRIKQRCGNARFEILLGSALKGAAINVLEKNLMEHSVQNEGDQHV